MPSQTCACVLKREYVGRVGGARPFGVKTSARGRLGQFFPERLRVKQRESRDLDFQVGLS